MIIIVNIQLLDTPLQPPKSWYKYPVWDINIHCWPPCAASAASGGGSSRALQLSSRTCRWPSRYLAMYLRPLVLATASNPVSAYAYVARDKQSYL